MKGDVTPAQGLKRFILSVLVFHLCRGFLAASQPCVIVGYFTFNGKRDHWNAEITVVGLWVVSSLKKAKWCNIPVLATPRM